MDQVATGKAIARAKAKVTDRMVVVMGLLDTVEHQAMGLPKAQPLQDRQGHPDNPDHREQQVLGQTSDPKTLMLHMVDMPTTWPGTLTMPLSNNSSRRLREPLQDHQMILHHLHHPADRHLQMVVTTM